jgi:glycosyltransferase involved in cell wall biosynthesis
LRVAADLSCLADRPLTGVGYYTQHLFAALLETRPEVMLTALVAGAGARSEHLGALRERGARCVVSRWPTRLRLGLGRHFGVPKLEHFTGTVELVHGGFHFLPPARAKARVVTVFDCTALRHPEQHTPASATLHQGLLRHAARHATRLIAISEAVKRECVALLSVAPEQVDVVPGGVHTEEFEAPLDAARLDALRRRFAISGPYWIHVGTLEPRKNLARLLAAYARLRASGVELPALVLAGKPGWMQESAESLIARHGLAGAVIATGYLGRTEAVTLLRGAAGCVYPSLYEGFGLPVLEAMAARVPVLTSTVSSLPEVAGDAAILVDPQSVEAIAAGLRALLTADAARIARGYARAQAFTWTRSAEALAAAYRRAVAEGGA